MHPKHINERFERLEQKIKELENEIEKLKENDELARQCWADHLNKQHGMG